MKEILCVVAGTILFVKVVNWMGQPAVPPRQRRGDIFSKEPIVVGCSSHNPAYNSVVTKINTKKRKGVSQARKDQMFGTYDPRKQNWKYN